MAAQNNGLKQLLASLTLTLQLTTLGGCSSKEASVDSVTSALPRDTAKPSALIHRAPVDVDLYDQAAKQLQLCVTQADHLYAALETMLSAPNSGTLDEARQAWQRLQRPCEHFFTLAHLTTAGTNPIEALDAVQTRVAAWPIQPGFLDRLGEYSYSGLVFDISTPLEPATLRAQHQLTEAEEVVTGIYAIHFLLFGEKSRRQPADFTAQAISAEHQEKGFKQTEELPNNRRRALLQLQGQLLLEDLRLIQVLWQSVELKERVSSLDTAALSRAAVTLFAHDLLAIATITSQKEELPYFKIRERQLIDRLRWHAQIWRELIPHTGFHQPDVVQALSARVLNTMQALPENQTQDTPMDWPATYRAVNALAQHLQLARVYEQTPGNAPSGE